MTTKKPDYVTREARRAVDAMLMALLSGRISMVREKLISARVQEYRRVLRRAARECEAVQQRNATIMRRTGLAEDVSVQRLRNYGAVTATECRDAIRALATGGRG